MFAVITVNDLSDNLNVDGRITLREALEAANLDRSIGDAPAGRGADTIRFEPALLAQGTATIRLQPGSPLTIRSEVLIEGPGADRLKISAPFSAVNNPGEIARIHVIRDPQAIATISAVGITGAFSEGVEFLAYGSGIINEGRLRLQQVDIGFNRADFGGGIRNEGTLVVDNSTIRDNRARNAGAGIYNGSQGSLWVTNSRIAVNWPSVDATRDGDFGGGGIYNASEATIIGSVIAENRALLGGGVRSPGALRLERTTVENNWAQSLTGIATGGGVVVGRGGATLRESVIRGNTADGNGGGVAIVSDDGNALDVFIESSTIEGNLAAGSGGGLYLRGEVEATMRASTVSGNRANLDAAGVVVITGELSVYDSTITKNVTNGETAGYLGAFRHLTNSIIADNVTRSGQFDVRILPDEADARFDHNLIGVVPADLDFNMLALLNDTARHNLYGSASRPLDPLLNPLGSYGGVTKTHSLKANSPAIDAGQSEWFVDQRGHSATDIVGVRDGQNGLTIRDIGAFELGGAAAADWESRVTGSSQFGPSAALKFGVGYDVPGGQVDKEPGFLGFQFDTGPTTIGGITEGLLGDRWGGELRYDFAGRFGIEYGYIVDSGSLDADYLGSLDFAMNKTDDGGIAIGSSISFDSGRLYTASPRFGAYADLVMELDASVGGEGCLIYCVGDDIPIRLNRKVPLFSINRQDVETGELDGEIFIVGQDLIPSILGGGGDESQEADEIYQANEDARQAEIDRARAKDDLDAADEGGRADAQRRYNEANARIQEAEKKLREIDEKTKKPDDEDEERGADSGLSVSFGEAEGGLLGVQATLSAASGIDGLGGLEVEVGSLAVTMPDVQLDGTMVQGTGRISASTDDEAFENDEEKMARRQIAQLSIDIGAVLGKLLGIPAGRMSAELGPLAFDIQSVSYDVISTLLINQDVELVPYVKNTRFEFVTKGTDQPTTVSIKKNGQLSQASFIDVVPSDQLQVYPGGAEIDVLPTLDIGYRFSNDIGLNLDFEGLFSAFSLAMSAFDTELFNLGPLLSYRHRLGEFDLGSVFDRTFDVASETTSTFARSATEPATGVEGKLSRFALAASGPAGGSFASPFVMKGNDSLVVNPAAGGITFIQVARTDVDGMAWSDLKFTTVPGNKIQAVGVMDQGVTLLQGDHLGRNLSLVPGEWTDTDPYRIDPQSIVLSGFDRGAAGDQATVTVALMFENASPARITTFLQGVPQSNVIPQAETRIEEPTTEAQELRVVYEAPDLTFDIDGDGALLPLSDGILVQRYLRGVRGAALIDGALGSRAKRSTAQAVRLYLDTLEPRLDVDGNGLADAEADGELILRALAGFTGDALIQGVLAHDASDSASDVILERVLGTTSNLSESLPRVEFRDGEAVVGQGLTAIPQAATNSDLPLIKRYGHVDPLGLQQPPDLPAELAVGSTPYKPLQPQGNGNTQTFELTQFGQSLLYQELYLIDAGSPSRQLIGRAPAGAPYAWINDGLLKSDGTFKRATIDALRDRLSEQNASRQLGTEEPLYLGLTAGASYKFKMPAGYVVGSLIMPEGIGGNAVLDGFGDIYEIHGNTGLWRRHVDLSLPHRLSDGTTAFELYLDRLPNQTIHRTANEANAAIDEGVVIGLTLLRTDNTGGVPTIEVERTGRPALRSPQVNLIQQTDLVGDGRIRFRRTLNDGNLPDRENIVTLFNGLRVPFVVNRGLVQEGARVTDEWTPLHSVRAGAIANLVVRDRPDSQQMVIIDESAGPLNMPILFRAGKEYGPDEVGGSNLPPLPADGPLPQNSLFTTLYDGIWVDSENTLIDLVDSGTNDSHNRFGSRVEVEMQGARYIDLRGAKPGAEANELRVHPSALRRNQPNASGVTSLYVLRDRLDSVTLEGAWRAGGTTISQGMEFAEWIATVHDRNVHLWVQITEGVSAVAASDSPGESMLTAQADGYFTTIPGEISQRTRPIAAEPDLPNQFVITTPQDLKQLHAGDTFQLNVAYNVQNQDNTLPGLVLRLHFDSSQLMFDGFAAPVTEPVPSAYQVLDDFENWDLDPATDKVLNVLWTNTIPSSGFPNVPLPHELIKPRFVIAHGDTPFTTEIAVTGASVFTHELVATPERVTVQVTKPLASVGLNFVGGRPVGGAAVNQTAGVVPIDLWNNGAGAAGTLSHLVDDAGRSTTIGAQWISNNTWSVSTTTPQDGHAQMYQGYLDTTADSTTSVLLRDIPYLVYDLYVYYDGDVATGRSGIYTVTDAGGLHVQGPYRDTADWPVQAGGTPYRLSDEAGESGNYLIFRGLTGSVVTLTATPESPAAFRAPVNAIQIVAVEGPLVVTATDDTLDGVRSNYHRSLREAVERANEIPGPNTIAFELPDGSSVELSGTPIRITEDLTIRGNGADQLAIDGNRLSRVLEIASGVTVTIDGLTVRGGHASEGGGILNEGHLRLTRSSVQGNRATTSHGGGILQRSGYLELIDSSLRGNQAETLGGALFVESGSVIIENSTIGRNRAGRAGALAMVGGNGSLIHTTITENRDDAREPGNDVGGIEVSGSGLLSLLNSIVAGNLPAQAHDARTSGGTILSRGNNVLGDSDGFMRHVTDEDPYGLALSPLENTNNGTSIYAPRSSSQVVQRVSTGEYSKAVLADEPLAYYALDDTTGIDAKDSSPNGLHGTYVNRSVANGELSAFPASHSLGLAASFNGVNQHVQLPNRFTDFSSGITIEAWVLPEAVDTWARMVELGNGINSDNIILGRLANTNDLFFEVYRGGISAGKVIASQAIDLHRWQHVVAVQQPTGDVQLYRDGVQLATTGSTGLPRNVQRTRNYIARSNYPNDEYFTGSMASVAIYREPLLSSEVKRHYRASFAAGELARQGSVSMSSASETAARANDGNASTVAMTEPGDANPWWELDLLTTQRIGQIVLSNRVDCCQSRLRDLTVQILDDVGQPIWSSERLNAENAGFTYPAGPSSITVDVERWVPGGVLGRKVRILRAADLDLSGTNGQGGVVEQNVLAIAEVQVYAARTLTDQRGFNRPSTAGASTETGAAMVLPRIPGDSNHDGAFNSSDLIDVFMAGEYEDGIDDNSTFEEGDWNGDGDFDSSDLVAAFVAGLYESE